MPAIGGEQSFAQVVDRATAEQSGHARKHVLFVDDDVGRRGQKQRVLQDATNVD